MAPRCIRCGQLADLPLITCTRCYAETHGIKGCLYCAFGIFPRAPQCTCDNTLRATAAWLTIRYA